jgi:hypothetical protein
MNASDQALSFRIRAAVLFGVAFAAPVDCLTIAAETNRDQDRAAVDVGAQRSADHLMPFLRDHCMDCHDGQQGEGGFDLHQIKASDFADLGQGQNLDAWVRVFDRVNQGEMPPQESGEIDEVEKQDFLERAYEAIDRAESGKHASLGRVRARRLTRDQLQSTLCDLLSIDIPLAQLIPEEQRTDGFRNISDAQSMSHYYLEDHLRVVDAALDEAFGRVGSSPSRVVIDLPASRIADKRKGQRNREPELRQGAAVVWSGGVSFYGRISSSRIEQAGWYRITLNASAVKSPDDQGVWCSVRSGECVSQAPLMKWIGSFEATESPKTWSFTAWLEADHRLEIRPADGTLKKARFRGGQIGFGEGESQDVPGVAMHSLKLERIDPGGDQDAVLQSLFGDLATRLDNQTGRLLLDSDSPQRDLKKQLRRFARLAFRGPVSQATLLPYMQMIDKAVTSQEDPVAVLRQTYRAILCSPRLIYFTEAPGPLEDHAVANRLSYLLTGKAPDKTLRRVADQGRLTDPQVLVAQTRRLLQGQQLRRFVDDFSDQWLDLADIGFTEPDRRMHGDFDLVVQNAMLEETRRFLETLIRENQPARALVDSDFTWLNNRLARYYGIDATIEPSTWKRVSVAEHPYRGGLMTHGAILKVTANGTHTSPVVRGVWICDRLLGIPIPDPPENVPAIEPDVRGAKTVRQILEQHRSQAECASCHARIDPPGFALEHFDAAGRWRDHYLTRKNKSYHEGPKVDSAYQLADGRPFDSFAEFRELVANDDAKVARNFAAKLLTYATGQNVTFADRKALDQILSQTKQDQYRLRSLIEAVVTSPPFLNK